MFASLLAVFSIAISVALLLMVERTKRAAEEGFTQSVSQVDLLVGARTGPLNLILFTVFNMGTASNDISWKSYQEIKKRPDVEWTIPYSLGDGHRGFRVVGTDENFYEHYHFRGQQKVEFAQGVPALGIWDVALGSKVADKLGYQIGDEVVISHGGTHGEGFIQHDDKPFHVVGILKPTGTAIDQSIYISLYGMEALHIDFHDGAPHAHSKDDHHDLKKEDIKIDEISAFFLRTKSRVETLQLQRDLNNYPAEPLLAIIPGVTLAELWRGLSQIEVVLRVITLLVLAVGLGTMMSSLLASLNGRRREMAILRSLGAGPVRLAGLLMIESSLLAATAVGMGVIIRFASFAFLGQWLEREFGFYLTGSFFTVNEYMYMVGIWIIGTGMGLFPAVVSSRRALKDGLTVRV